jgi:misacylated tRNA(Ala) deacylase
MTILLYQQDSYIKEFDAVVTHVNETDRAVILDRSAFYPGGGGQPYDTGTLEISGGIYPVKKVRKGPEGSWHFLGSENGLPVVNTLAHGIIDWDRRYKLMRTHSALHILCGVIFRDYGAQVTGGDMEPLKGRMDFEFETLTKDLIAVIEESVNREVTLGHPIHVKILPREEAFKIPDLIRTKINLLPPDIKEVRTIEIEGLDLQADGGTHVNNTSEIGTIRITDYKSKGKINKRIYIEMA